MAENANLTSNRWMCTVFDNVWTPTFTPEMLFATWQRETCPETGRIHVHIYVRFQGRKRMQTVKNIFMRADMHCERAQGTEAECTDYCEKEPRLEAGTRWNPNNYDGNIGKQGRRTDLEAISEKCSAGTSIREIALAHPGDFIRYHAGIQALHAQVAPRPPVARDVTITIYWGRTRLGKTHRVMTRYPDCYCVKPGRDAWGLYRGEECIFFDEFNWKQWPITEMNRYLDKWRVLLDCRYRDSFAAWTHVAICANSSPVSWYSNEDWPLVEAFRRRIEHSSFLVLSQEQTDEEMEQTPNFGADNEEIPVYATDE